MTPVEFAPDYKRYEPAFVQTFGVDFDTGLFRLFTDVEVRETKSFSVYFAPYRADFVIGGELEYRGIFAGLVHECNHDVVTWGELQPNNGWDTAWTTAYAGWKGEFAPHELALLRPLVFAGLYLYDNAEIKFTDSFIKYERAQRGFSWIDNIVFIKAGGSAELLRALTGSLYVQGEFIPSGGWHRLTCDAGLEVHYRGLGMGAAWKGQKRLDSEGYAVNEIRFYLVFRGRAALF